MARAGLRRFRGVEVIISIPDHMIHGQSATRAERIVGKAANRPADPNRTACRRLAPRHALSIHGKSDDGYMRDLNRIL